MKSSEGERQGKKNVDIPVGMGSLRKRSPKTGWIDLPSGELAMYSQKGEWGCEMMKWYLWVSSEERREWGQ